jgi:hypothetical protein
LTPATPKWRFKLSSTTSGGWDNWSWKLSNTVLLRQMLSAI